MAEPRDLEIVIGGLDQRMYVFDGDGEKIRTVQFRGAGIILPTSLWFADRTRILVTPGCYEFPAR